MTAKGCDATPAPAGERGTSPLAPTWSAAGGAPDALAAQLKRTELQRSTSSIPRRLIVQVLTEIPAAVESGCHTHPGEEVGYIVEGTGEMRRRDEPDLLLHAGDGLLVAHGDDDQIVPIGAAAHKSDELLPRATLKVYRGRPHGLHGAYELEFNDDLLAFLNENPTLRQEPATTGGAHDD